MKAILKFDLSDPDDREDHERIMKATDMASVLWELSTNSKKTMEWELDTHPEMTAGEALDMFYEKFNELMEDNDINIDRIYR
jgi:hypothetical protein